MSQYGAAGFAEHGFTHEQILTHYFTGTEIGHADTDTVVRVLLQSPGTATFTGATNAGTKRLDPGRTYGARAASGGRVDLLDAGGRVLATFDAPLRATNAANDPVKLFGTAGNGVRDGAYRGWLEFRPGGAGEVLAVNAVGLEQYVAGVIANEAIPSWPMEALESQAVASRGYALTTRKTEARGWDLYPDTRSQVYRGVAAEGVRSNAAVSGTAGNILTYGGAPAVTYYFSTSGGHTESIQYSFVGSLSKPWLVGVPDPYDYHSPYHRWRTAFTARQLTRALGSRGTFRKLKVLKRGTSPRIVRAQVVGSRGTRTITGPTLRAALGLRDTWARFTRVSTAARASHGTPVGRAAVASVPPALASIHGSLDPVPKGDLLIVERRVDGRWKKIRRVRMGSGGSYRAEVRRPGVYRVRSGVIAGPAVRVR
jgi:stage II sporulation protein D